MQDWTPILVALITGVCAVIGTWLTVGKTAREVERQVTVNSNTSNPPTMLDTLHDVRDRIARLEGRHEAEAQAGERTHTALWHALAEHERKPHPHDGHNGD